MNHFVEGSYTISGLESCNIGANLGRVSVVLGKGENRVYLVDIACNIIALVVSLNTLSYFPVLDSVKLLHGSRLSCLLPLDLIPKPPP